MMGRPSRNAIRLRELRMLRFCRGFLTLEERQEKARLEKQRRQQEKRRERYASDPDYRARVVGRVLSWERERKGVAA